MVWRDWKGRQARKWAGAGRYNLLAGLNRLPEHAARMQVPIANQATVPAEPWSRKKELVVKFVVLTLFTAVLGFAQGWATTRYYKPDQMPGFRMGLLHGFLMPAALPTLVMGHDLPIYATNNQGPPYKIGYIIGLNSCGTIFFGISFVRFRRRTQ
jgi:hypothetical protein